MNFQKSAANFYDKRMPNQLAWRRWHKSLSLLCALTALATVTLWMHHHRTAAAYQIPPYRQGDIFVSTLYGIVYRYDQPTGRLLQSLDAIDRGFMSGMAFDKQGNLFATLFGAGRVAKFDASGNLLGNFGSGYGRFPKSIILDPDGNVYVGSVDGDNDVLKFSPSGTLLDRYDVQTEIRGADWIDLAGDRCTLYYTSEGTSVKRFNICTKRQLPDFVQNLPYFGVQGIRLLPDGGMLVADNDEILRLNASGAIVKRYDVAGINCWFTMNLNADGKSFWSIDYDTGFIHRFDLETGAVLGTIYTGQRLMGLAILGEVTAVPTPTPTPTPTPSPTATPTPTPTPTPAADLAVMNSVSPSIVTKGSIVTFTAMVTNNGPGTALNVRVNNWLPRGFTLLSCRASVGRCEVLPTDGIGEINFLGAGLKATFEFVARVDDCVATENNARALNMFKATANNPDPNMENNQANTLIDLAPPAPRITIASNAFNFGIKTLTRTTDPNPPFSSFTVVNDGCLPLNLNGAAVRTGADTTNGKITNPDDSTVFPFAIVEVGVPRFLGRTENVTIPPAGSATFRLYFNPRIPAPAGRLTGLSAPQVLPDSFTSSLRLTTNGGNFVYPITAGISTPFTLINPLATSLSPLVVMARNGDEYAVEFSTHDSNMDIFCATYQFLDSNDRPVGEAPTFYLDTEIAAANMVRGQSFTIVKRFSGANQRPEVKRVRVTIHDRELNQTVLSSDIGTANGRVVNVSAASFAANATLSAESIVAAFGERLATGVGTTPSVTLPIELKGTQVAVMDSNNIERLAPLFFVAPGQVNYLLPQDVPLGPARVTVASADGTLSIGTVTITDSAPALFSASSNGQGIAAGVILRVKTDGSLAYEPLARWDAVANRMVAVPVDMSSEQERVYLVLFGTGIRHYRSPVRPVRVSLGSTAVPVLFAGPQGGFAGLDQINVPIPMSLRGSGEIEINLTVDGRTANSVRVWLR